MTPAVCLASCSCAAPAFLRCVRMRLELRVAGKPPGEFSCQAVRRGWGGPAELQPGIEPQAQFTGAGKGGATTARAPLPV